MKRTRLTYDPEGDILYITFGHPTAATGYQLSDQLLLRVNPETHEVAGLTILNFSVHVQAEHELPLPGLDEELEVKAWLLQLLNTPPVAHFLGVVEGEHGARVTLRQPSLQEALVG